jgi:radical SAM/Cys-rich protein
MPVALNMAPSPGSNGPEGTLFDAKLEQAGLFPLHAVEISTLQINVGKRCNQACKHCHVDAGPHRTEEMTRETAALVIDVLRRHPRIGTLDITGGAPELNPCFEYLVSEARALGRHVMDRCNLTILFVPGKERLAEFVAEHRVEIVASLPYYLAQRTDAQRGIGVFEQSVAGLKRLNALGYGQPDSGLVLNLVYNPTGAFLPPAQAAIEREYRDELMRRHGIVFNHLYTITNMPIARFAHFLRRTNNYDRYLDKLAAPLIRPPPPTSCAARSFRSAGTARCTTATSTVCWNCPYPAAPRATCATSTTMLLFGGASCSAIIVWAARRARVPPAAAWWHNLSLRRSARIHIAAPRSRARGRSRAGAPAKTAARRSACSRSVAFPAAGRGSDPAAKRRKRVCGSRPWARCPFHGPITGLIGPSVNACSPKAPA